jgi:hypothetical protein
MFPAYQGIESTEGLAFHDAGVFVAGSSSVHFVDFGVSAGFPHFLSLQRNQVSAAQ